MSQKTWNWAIFGPGIIARTFADALKLLDRAKLVAVASSSSQRANTFAEEYDVPHVYGSYSEALKDEAIDVCYISTIHVSHYPIAKACLEAGKNVLIEKPICLNQDELQELIELAKAKNCFMMEAMWTRFRPTTLQVLDWTKNAIGDLVAVKTTLSFDSDLKPGTRITSVDLGGGALLDMGVYGIAYINMLFDEKPNKLFYNAQTIENQVDIAGVISLTYPNFRLASIHLSVKNALDDNALILGTKGYIKVQDFHKPKSAQLYEYTNRAEREARLVDEVTEKPIGNGYQYEAEHVMDCLDQGLKQSPVYPLSASLDNLWIMDQLREDIGLKYPQE